MRSPILRPAFERLQVVQNFRALQAAWDAEHAQAEMPEPRPSAARAAQGIGACLIAFVVGALLVAALP